MSHLLRIMDILWHIGQNVWGCFGGHLQWEIFSKP